MIRIDKQFEPNDPKQGNCFIDNGNFKKPKNKLKHSKSLSMKEITDEIKRNLEMKVKGIASDIKNNLEMLSQNVEKMPGSNYQDFMQNERKSKKRRGEKLENEAAHGKRKCPVDIGEISGSEFTLKSKVGDCMTSKRERPSKLDCEISDEDRYLSLENDESLRNTGVFSTNNISYIPIVIKETSNNGCKIASLNIENFFGNSVDGSKVIIEKKRKKKYKLDSINIEEHSKCCTQNNDTIGHENSHIKRKNKSKVRSRNILEPQELNLVKDNVEAKKKSKLNLIYVEKHQEMYLQNQDIKSNNFSTKKKKKSKSHSPSIEEHLDTSKTSKVHHNEKLNIKNKKKSKTYPINLEEHQELSSQDNDTTVDNNVNHKKKSKSHSASIEEHQNLSITSVEHHNEKLNIKKKSKTCPINLEEHQELSSQDNDTTVDNNVNHKKKSKSHSASIEEHLDTSKTSKVHHIEKLNIKNKKKSKNCPINLEEYQELSSQDNDIIIYSTLNPLKRFKTNSISIVEHQESSYLHSTTVEDKIDFKNQNNEVRKESCNELPKKKSMSHSIQVEDHQELSTQDNDNPETKKNSKFHCTSLEKHQKLFTLNNEIFANNKFRAPSKCPEEHEELSTPDEDIVDLKKKKKSPSHLISLEEHQHNDTADNNLNAKKKKKSNSHLISLEEHQQLFTQDNAIIDLKERQKSKSHCININTHQVVSNRNLKRVTNDFSNSGNISSMLFTDHKTILSSKTVDPNMEGTATSGTNKSIAYIDSALAVRNTISDHLLGVEDVTRNLGSTRNISCEDESVVSHTDVLLRKRMLSLDTEEIVEKVDNISYPDISNLRQARKSIFNVQLNKITAIEERDSDDILLKQKNLRSDMTCSGSERKDIKYKSLNPASLNTELNIGGILKEVRIVIERINIAGDRVTLDEIRSLVGHGLVDSDLIDSNGDTEGSKRFINRHSNSKETDKSSENQIDNSPPRKLSIKRRKNNVKSLNFQCQHCESSFATPYELAQHARQSHKDLWQAHKEEIIQIKKEKSILWTVEEKQKMANFEISWILTYGIRPKGTVIEYEIGRPMTSVNRIKKHDKVYKEIFEQKMTEHKISDSMIDKSKSVLQCSKCDVEYCLKYQIDLYHHVRLGQCTTSSEKNNENYKSLTDDDDDFQSNTEGDSAKFGCKYCESKFIYKVRLVHHMRKKHRDQYIEDEETRPKKKYKKFRHWTAEEKENMAKLEAKLILERGLKPSSSVLHKDLNREIWGLMDTRRGDKEYQNLLKKYLPDGKPYEFAIITNEGLYACPLCHRNFKAYYGYRKHVDVQHDGKVIEPEEFTDNV